MENPEVAQVFEEVADLLDIQGENPFRVRAYRNAAHALRDLAEPLAEMAHNGQHKLEDLPGIGKDLAGKIRTTLKTGDLSLRQELRGQVPPGLRDLITVPGLGPKRAQTLHQQLRIGSLDDLREAAEKHSIRKLRGFEARTEERTLQALEGREETGRRALLAEAKVFADAVVRHLRQAPGIGQVEVAGSFRRRKETVGDLDLLATCQRPGLTSIPPELREA